MENEMMNEQVETEVQEEVKVRRRENYPEAIAYLPKSTQMFVKRIHNRIENGKNCLIAVVGPTGGGKSYAAFHLMLALDLYRYGKAKDIQWYQDHCVFRASDFMKGLNSETLKKKTTWMWDEAGVDAGTQEHATVKNKVIGWLAQTFRNLQQVIFFTLPSLGMLTPQVRKLLHFYLEALTIDEKRKICVMKPLEIQYNIRMDKIYYHNLKVSTTDGFFEEIEVIGVPLAPKEYLDFYEQKKNSFTQDLNIEIQRILQVIEKKSGPNPYDRFTDLQKKVHHAIIDKGINTKTDLANYLGVKVDVVATSLRLMGNKGQYYPQIVRKKPVYNISAKNALETDNVKNLQQKVVTKLEETPHKNKENDFDLD